MLKRDSRLRREYLYRKSLEAKEQAIAAKKDKLKKAIEAGKSIPTELRGEEATLRHEIELDDNRTEKAQHSQDDEYVNAGIRDPKVMVTSSRDPSSKLTQFLKEVRLLIPNAQRINRGGYTMAEIVDACKRNEVTDLVVVHEHRGVPDGMVVCHLPYGPTAHFSLANVVTRHDIMSKETIPEQYPHLIFDNMKANLGQRVTNILKYLFPVPKPESKRLVTFANREDWISFRHHVFRSKGKEVQLLELGPRFDMRVVAVKRGTADEQDAAVEWAYRPYMNTAKRRRHLEEQG